jgi:Fe-S cluster assembly iron-binding protein IscA
MSVDVTPEAVEVLKRSLAMGDAKAVRLRAARELGGGLRVQVELAEEPLEGEEVVEVEGVRIFVDPAVSEAVPNAVVAVEPQHETIVVRPGES